MEREKMNTRTLLVGLVSLLATTAAMSTLAEESTYRFTRGFPADETTIKQALDATELRRAIEAYKFFYPTVATEAVIQQFEPHGAVPNKVGIIMPQDPEQQFSVANQDTLLAQRCDGQALYRRGVNDAGSDER
jgi:hypothetical protein